MNKYPLIGVSICAVVLLILGSLSNVVGIENVKSCNCCDPPCWPELSGTMGDNDWYVSSVGVWFNGSSSRIDYRIDGGNWTVYTAPFALTTEGRHLLEWMCDGNISDIYSIEIKIDTTPPRITETPQKRIGLFQWQFSVNASDNISGVNRVEFFFDGYIDTEPPYQHTWTGCMLYIRFLNFIYRFFLGIIPIYFDAWDNAGHSTIKPS
jgi:hypothetical protein